MSPPRPLLKNWFRFDRRLTSVLRLGLFSDFDGTLVGLRSDPDVVRFGQNTRRLLDSLRAHGVAVGILSGRQLEDLVARVAVAGLWYVGDHGFTLQDPQGRRLLLAPATARRRIAALGRLLQSQLKTVPGILIEHKLATVAVHYRSASPAAVHRARAVVQKILSENRDVRVLAGKKVWELLPAEPVSKWTALAQIVRAEKLCTPKALFFYLGDDTTDERVFRGMRRCGPASCSVAVGDRRPTAARYALKGPGEVKVFLRRLLAAWRKCRSG